MTSLPDPNIKSHNRIEKEPVLIVGCLNRRSLPLKKGIISSCDLTPFLLLCGIIQCLPKAGPYINIPYKTTWNNPHAEPRRSRSTSKLFN